MATDDITPLFSEALVVISVYDPSVLFLLEEDINLRVRDNNYLSSEGDSVDWKRFLFQKMRYRSYKMDRQREEIRREAERAYHRPSVLSKRTEREALIQARQEMLEEIPSWVTEKWRDVYLFYTQGTVFEELHTYYRYLFNCWPYYILSFDCSGIMLSMDGQINSIVHNQKSLGGWIQIDQDMDITSEDKNMRGMILRHIWSPPVSPNKPDLHSFIHRLRERAGLEGLSVSEEMEKECNHIAGAAGDFFSWVE
ncbi:hypothetical protein PROFUN_06663 [Planoprotostelium fungivorum]|uniref:Uncharacterized protein n=1 Tax=Planoprotostelium fungivorum TaxID=1890364 RepID=A0A2P6MSX2_9EUKA|nr:hypothetical protein PROFUN_06663 [Planoprotostelium fungivorum]